MTDAELLELLRDRFDDGSFSPLEALECLTFSQLPGHVRAYLRVHGPGVGATKAMARHLTDIGVQRLSTRTRAGYLLTVPAPACDHCLKPHPGPCAFREVPAAPQPDTYVEEINHDPRS
jgi:hypothetical protein